MVKNESILITGGSGLLAVNWALSIRDKHEVTLLLHQRKISLQGVKTDVMPLNPLGECITAINKHQPDVVIHTAGLTSAEECESNPRLAQEINVELARNVASACNHCNVKFVHISTDHLFSGCSKFYKETDKPSPLNVYARTKLEAENEVLKSNPKSLIVRTNFFGWGPSYRHSLTDKIIYALRKGNRITLFDDVFFTPILASELINSVHRLLDLGTTGIINVVGNERLSKYGFGLKVANIFGLNNELIERSSIESNIDLTLRPKDMSLSNHKFLKLTGGSIKSFDEQLIDLAYQESESQTISNDSGMIPYGKHHIDEDDIQAVANVLRGGCLTQGPVVGEFEKAVSEYVGSKYAVAVSSGTAALHLAALVAEVGPGTALVTSPITFVASANSALYVGARVLFADIDPQTINMSPESLRQVIKDNPDVRAVIPVHFAGLPCDMPAIKSVADQVGAIIIEDAAHALGSKYPDGQQVGCCSHSHMTIFSFHPVKTIAAGEGGMITTNDKRIYQKLLRLRSHGINKLGDSLLLPEQAIEYGIRDPWYYEMQELGFNYRITDIQCALGLSQFKKIEKFVAKRRKIAERYDAEFSNMSYCQPAQKNIPHNYSSYHLYVILINFNKIGISRAQLMQSLMDQKIGSQVHYIPVVSHPFYRQMGFKPEDYPKALKYYQEALSIPIFNELTDNQQSFIISTLRSITS